MEDNKRELLNEAIRKVGDYKKRFEAVGVLKKFADEGNSEAMYWLSVCCRYSMKSSDSNLDSTSGNEWFRPNPVKEMQLLQQSADLGFPRAQYDLAMLYYTGGTRRPRNTEKAFQYFKSAAEQGCAPAEYMLARNFSSLYTRMNYDEGVDLCKKAAEDGYAEAEYELSQLYLAGRDIDNNGASPENPDWKNAFYWLKRAAEHGLNSAQYEAALLMLEGRVTEKNEQEAIELLTRAADKKLTPAVVKLTELGITWKSRFDRWEEQGHRIPKKILDD